MSLTHNYVVSSAVSFLDQATIIGTVDSIPSTGPIAVTIIVSTSTLLQIIAKGGIAAAESYVGPLMLSAAIANGLPIPASATFTALPTGTFSQGGHTYVVSTVTNVGDVLTITGTVDGQATTIKSSASQLVQINNQSGVVALENHVAPIMLEAAYAAGLVKPTITQLPTGSFSM